jgi:hypothetical protein
LEHENSDLIIETMRSAIIVNTCTGIFRETHIEQL